MTQTYEQHRRIDRLRDLLTRHPRGVTLYQLSAMLGVGPRTMRRYLKEVERQYDLAPVRERGGGPVLWRIAPHELPRKVEVRRAQAYSLLATRRVFEPLRGSALYDEIQLAINNLMGFAGRVGRGPNAGSTNTSLEQRFQYLPQADRLLPEGAEEIDELFQAVSELRPVSLRYRALGATREERLQIHPYGMVLYRDGVYCVGCQLPEERIRTFALSRMRDIRIDERRRFSVPKDFRLEDHFDGEFGPACCEDPKRVVLEVTTQLARGLRARRLHASQKMSSASGGRVRVSLELADPVALLPWILQRGRAVRVVSPSSLREAVVEHLTRALSNYE